LSPGVNLTVERIVDYLDFFLGTPGYRTILKSKLIAANLEAQGVA